VPLLALGEVTLPRVSDPGHSGKRGCRSRGTSPFPECQAVALGEDKLKTTFLIGQAGPAHRSNPIPHPLLPHSPTLAHRAIAALLHCAVAASSPPPPHLAAAASPPVRTLQRCGPPSLPARKSCSGVLPHSRQDPVRARAPLQSAGEPRSGAPSEVSLRSPPSSVCLSPYSPSPLGHGRRRRRAASPSTPWSARPRGATTSSPPWPPAATSSSSTPHAAGSPARTTP
jgi:hypothetical protein